MKPILDAAAGNRSMWKKGDRGHNPDIIFIDREYRLATPPDVFADFRYLPFRDDCFSLAIWDPPYHARSNPDGWRFVNPDQSKKSLVDGKYIKTWAHYGAYKSKRQLVINLLHGALDLFRVSHRLSLKWGEGTLSIWKVLPLLRPWREVYRYQRMSQGYYTSTRLFWITFERGEGRKLKQDTLIE